MKQPSQTMIAFAGFVALSLVATTADRTPAWADSGNQLMKNQTHWYEKAADKVAGVEGAKGTLVLKAGSYLYLEGDSTLHKYQMHAGSLQGSASVTGEDLLKALKAGTVKDMTFVVPVKDFKSRESGLDDNAYKALKATEDPTITFKLKSETLKDSALTAKGTLTIAGTTVPVTLEPTVTLKDGKVELKGTQALKMSDYGVKPPSISLVVTSITCTDDVQIHYDVIFGK